MANNENQSNGEQMRRLNKSFHDAYRGLKHSIIYERNFQIELVIAAFVLALILIFK